MYALLRFMAWQKGAGVEYQVTNSSFFESNIAWTMQLEPESEGHYGHGMHGRTGRISARPSFYRADHPAGAAQPYRDRDQDYEGQSGSGGADVYG